MKLVIHFIHFGKILSALAAVSLAAAVLLQSQAQAFAAAPRPAPPVNLQTVGSESNPKSESPIPLTRSSFGLGAAPAVKPSGRIYWGATINGKPPTNELLSAGGVFDTFEKQSAKQMAILHWGQPWKMDGKLQPFQLEYMNNVRNRGSIPLLDWGSWAWAVGAGPDQPEFRLSKIANGDFDSYIRQWALDAKAWGHPFFLRFDWEMNGDWQFPWAEQINGNQPGDYVKAWRHVHDIFTQSGAANVTWVWCPNIGSDITRSMASLYPGDAYVDWTCLDGYNKYDQWLSFNTIFSASGINWLDNSYQEIVSLAPGKPVMIGEMASLEAGDGGAKKAEWIRQAFSPAELAQNFPQIKAIVMFDWDDNRSNQTSMPIGSSAASIKAFAQALGSSQFATNEFANLGGAIILPLP